MAYYLTCPACAYREVVSELDEVVYRREQHQAEHGVRHAVGFEVVEDQPMFRGGVSDDWE